ncbi:MAG: proton-conducting transporter membrane subunit [Victivallales bacterium]|nr:proton-conducting transporter membrane subunit [Victivallales bacterium]
MISVLLLTPLVLAALMPGLRRRVMWQCRLVFAYAVGLAAAAVWFAVTGPEPGPASLLAVDDLSIWFLLIMAVVLVATTLYSCDFFRRPEEQETAERAWKYHVFLLLFVASMLGVLLSAHLGLLWVFVETSTLSSAMLVCYHPGRNSYEAAWKYIFICSIGISFAFIGIIFLSLSAAGLEHSSLSWDWLDSHAAQLNPFWLKTAMPLLLIGLGTKMGLAPMHNWLPDAHSEAPAPISATLSAALLNASCLGILRVHMILLRAGLGEYSRTILIVMGFLSLLVPAIFILRARNYKRMLAYSSVENMGIIAIGIGFGGAALFGALLHLAGHSLVKASFFLTSGNLYSIYHSKRIRDVHGIWRCDAMSAWLWLGGAVGICAFPPFVTFISEFNIMARMLQERAIVALLLFGLLLTVILGAMFKHVLGMVFGRPGFECGTDIDISDNASLLGPAAYLPQLVLLLAAVGLGLCLPDPVYHLMTKAVTFIGEQGL